VHALIEQFAAAGKPIGAPFTLVPGAASVAIAAAQHQQAPNAPFARETMRFGNRRVIAMVETRLQRAPGLRRGGDQTGSFRRRARQRLFAQHVFAGVERGFGHRRKPLMRRGHNHRIDVAGANHRLRFRVSAGTKRARQRFRARCVDVRHGHQARTRHTR
jgi:hypothetical protein